MNIRATAGAPAVTIPFDVETEQALLGAILINNEAFDRVGDFLLPEHFHEPLHQRLFEGIARVIRTGHLASPVTLRPYFALDEGLAQVGGTDYLVELVKFSPSVMNSADFGRMIYQLWVRRELLRTGQEITALAADPPIDMPASEQLEEAERMIFALGDRGGADQKVELASTVAARAIIQADAAFRNPGDVGSSTGIMALDKKIGGLVRGDLLVLAGFTSMGKTSLGQQICWYDAARDHGIYTATMEMFAEQYIMRHIAQFARVSAQKIEFGQITEDEMTRVIEAQERFNQVPLYIDGASKLRVSQIRSRARRVARRGKKLRGIMVDHLHFIEAENPRADALEKIEQITRDLKAMALELNCWVLLISHLNREVKNRTNKRPIMSDLHGSSSIEKNADVVLFVHRDEYWLKQNEPDQSEPDAYAKWLKECEQAAGRAELIVAKRRRGPTGTAFVRYDSELTYFSDYNAPQE
jgi:replicative DNA helicase